MHDADGNLWFCVADGTPGTWRQLSGAATSGQLHVLAGPVRVYDSRPGGTNDGPLAEEMGQQHSSLLLLYGTDGEASVAFDAGNTSRDIAHDLALVAAE